MQSRKWCFTINNYGENDTQRFHDLGRDLAGNGIKYLVVGRERAGTGTPHLQGYVVFNTNQRLGRIKSLLGERGHYETSRGTPLEASEYCKKDGDFDEFGELPRRVGRPPQPSVADFCDWVRATAPLEVTQRAIAINFPSLWLRYGERLLSLSLHLLGYPELETRPLRGWQSDLEEALNEEPDDRSIRFYVDEEGGKGKSYFIRYFFTKSEKCQMLGVGKRDDIAHVVDVSKSIFLFNVPRGGMEYLQYTILEQLKDRCVFSPKYNSVMKVLNSKCHVVVFCNEAPDMTKMSEDRYIVINL